MEKIRLPQDNMTPSQLKERNGEMELYSLGRPMKWNALQAMPADLRRKYLEKLRDEYRASQVMVAAMLGISVHTFRKQCTKWGIKFNPNGGHGNPDIIARWSEFLGEEYKPTKRPQPVKEADPEPVPFEHVHLVPRSGSMTFHGPACDALRTLQEALRDTPCSLTITWEVEE